MPARSERAPGVDNRCGWESPRPSYALFDACETLASNFAASVSDDTDRSSDERESPESW